MTKLFKKALLLVLALTMVVSSLIVPGTVVSAAAPVANISKTASTGTASAPIKETISLNSGWDFVHAAKYTYYGDNLTIKESDWKTVNLPHTWWKTGDGETKQTDKNVGWYRKRININNNMKNGRIWLEFEAAAHYTEVFVNGEKAGSHYGGYTKFRVDITNQVVFGKENTIVVSTDSDLSKTPPIGGGFNKFPGITGDVNLIYTESVFVALDDYGSPGVHVTPEVTNKSQNKWNVSVDATIVNKDSTKNAKVKTIIRDMKTFEKVAGISESITPFDESKMYGTKTYKTEEKTVSLKSGKNSFSLDIAFDNPRLWNGRQDPYRYALDFEVWVDGKLVDKVTQNFGFRYYEITKNGGFFLNGKSYPLRGVAYHEDYTGTGSAMTEKEWDESFKLIYELGGTFSRLSHYPHDPYSYELCDRYGIIVWTEIAIISGVTYSGTKVDADFEKHAEDQLRELILQQKNHPSIVVWGLENELDTGTNESRVKDTARFMNELHDLAKKLDPTRLTTQTAGLHHNWAQWEVDVTAFNFYPMWYGEGNFEAQYTTHRNSMDKIAHFKNTALGFVEYGAGAGISASQHSEYPERPEQTTVKFHPAEWQNTVHEEAIKMINNHPELWVASLWCMFDFACDPFNEGDFAGTNDKGLVSRNRKTKKDTYYLYQANWLDAKTVPVIHIASSSLTKREVDKNTVKVYSNLDTIELFRDGVSLGKKKNDGNGIFVWENVSFGSIGQTHTFTAKGSTTAKSGVATAKWTRIASENVEIDINRAQTYADEEKGTIGFSGNIEIKDITKIFTSKYNASFKVVKADGKTAVTSGAVEGGMKLIVTSESGKAKKEYILLSSNIAAGKPITASSYYGAKTPQSAIDGYIDTTHAWNAKESDYGSSWIMVDLGKTYTLNSSTIHFFEGHGTNRRYYYQIFVGTTKDNMVSIVDRSNNKEVGSVTDSLAGVKGRYVKIYISGNSDYNNGNKSAVAGINELEINGYNIIEGEAKFNHDDKIVVIPYTWEQNTNKDKLLNDFKIEGNGYVTLESPQFYLMNGDKLIVNDFAGGKTTYTIMLGKDPNGNCEVSLSINQIGYTLTASQKTFKYGSDVTLTFKLKDGYAKNYDFAITVNGKKVKLDSNGTYTFTNVIYDLLVSVEGVVKEDAVESKPADTNSDTNNSNGNNDSTNSDYTSEDDYWGGDDTDNDNNYTDNSTEQNGGDAQTNTDGNESKTDIGLIILVIAFGVLILGGAGTVIWVFCIKKKN